MGLDHIGILDKTLYGSISMDSPTLVAYVKGKLDEVQSSLLESAKSFRDRYGLP